MNEKEASGLRVGDIVAWNGCSGPRGRVARTAYKYIEIAWDDHSPVSYLHPADCSRVFRATSR